MYLNGFDMLRNGVLHDQSWVKWNMQQFHKSMQFVICQCMVCKEAWPINAKPKSAAGYMCSRCSRDKCVPKKFSDANAMIPAPVPIELQGLTQTEEMLIAQALSIMRIYIKPGGQRDYSGYCINLPQDLNGLASVLPRCPKDLSIIVVMVKGRGNTFKDVNVQRQKVHNALLWLLQNNSHYKDITIDQHALDCLPINGVPTDIMTIESDNDTVLDEVASPNIGPSVSDENDQVYNKSSEVSSFMPTKEWQQQELDAIKGQLSLNEPIAWPSVHNQPINEYQTPFLATLAFPTLFPDGKGDPTNPSLLKEIPLGERVKHLINLLKRLMENGFTDFTAIPDFHIGL